MSDYYGALSKEAMSDDNFDSDVSDGDLDNILADMDDLDANLFGTKAIKSSSTAAVPSKSEAIPIRSKSTPVSNPGKPNKSRLLAELFGDDNDIYSPRETATTPKIKSFDSTQPAEIKPLPSSSVSPQIKTSTSPTKQRSISPEPKMESSIGYLPTSEARTRRRQPLPSSTAPADDLWSKFLRTSSPEKTEIMFDKKPSIDSEENKSLYLETPPLSPKRTETSPKLTSRPDSKHSRFLSQAHVTITPPEVQNNPVELSPEKQMEALKPYIESLIEDYMNKFENRVDIKSKTTTKDLETQINDLMASQEKLQQSFDKSTQKIITQEECIQELKKLLESTSKDWQEKLQNFESTHQRTLTAVTETSSHQMTALDGKISQLEDQIYQLQSQQSQSEISNEKLHREYARRASDQLSSSLAALRSELDQELRSTTEKVRGLEHQLGRLGQQLEDEQARLDNMEDKYRQLNSRKSAQQDLEFRVEQTENNLDTRLTSTNKQHVRLATWQEKQLADLSEYIDQRLWSLYNQLEIQRKELVNIGHKFLETQAALLEPCSESQIVRKLLTERENSRKSWQEKQEHRMSELDNRMTTTQSETCKLSRLAERLCTILQMWEQRHKVSARLEHDTMQSLQERYNMAIIQMSQNKPNTK